MEMDNRRDLVISGSGSSSGGSFRDVKINGDGKVYGNLDCAQFKTNGKSGVNGNVRSRSVRINGMTAISGDLDADEVKINGNMQVEGNGKCRDFKCNGHTSIKGNFTGDNVGLAGELTVGGDCQAEVFDAKGAFSIEGLLNAGVLEITLYGDSRAQEIGGEKITVRKQTGFRSLLQSFLPVFSTNLTAETIEGDEIYLENTKAKVVRGSRITVGPGCDIELVEYKTDLIALKGAKIHDSTKI